MTYEPLLSPTATRRCVSLARSYMRGPAGAGALSEAVAAEVVVSAARELLYSCSTLEDAALRTAQECLALASGPAVQHELDTLAALALLPSLGVSLAPVQLGQVHSDGKVANRDLGFGTARQEMVLE
jgi:hypothetical protein